MPDHAVDEQSRVSDLVTGCVQRRTGATAPLSGRALVLCWLALEDPERGELALASMPLSTLTSTQRMSSSSRSA